MVSLLLTYLFFSLLHIFALANDADQVVLGDLRTIKVFEPSPTSSFEPSPVGTDGSNAITPHVVPSAFPTGLPIASFSLAGPGTGGGPTCVQSCLARAASQVGCGGSANFWCVCKKNAYIGKAWDCFGQSGCPGDAIGRALGDLNVACRPYKRLTAGDELPESPMITPEGTPVVALFGSGRFDEL
ncbi:unnamed protein product [Rhizoctonia solani]|uniref:CFEM domain-containing protein n=1 Tax=Rhizoctonia solani TaxID=456999 RepID=A0A8H3BXK6_9AGAM|nr:unnamed protein product [Rhizoctonia solani]